TTFDYNPTFPISALLLMAGLGTWGAFDATDAGTTVRGIAVVQAYELALLAMALLVLWPRRIAYETTSILIIFSIVRWAAPFLTAALAAEGRPVEAALLGGGLGLLAGGKAWAIACKVRLDARPWELGWDVLLHAIAAAGLPLLIHGISGRFGNALSIEAVHGVELAAWGAVALA